MLVVSVCSDFTTRRGICPSCGTRRMAEAAAHLVEEEVLVHAEIRPLQAKTAASDGQFTLIPNLFESLHERARIGGVM